MIAAALGHPQPYAVSHVEIGNEQGLDAALAAQFSAIATAMDARAGKLKLPFNFSYVFGPRPDLSPTGHWSHNWSVSAHAIQPLLVIHAWFLRDCL